MPGRIQVNILLSSQYPLLMNKKRQILIAIADDHKNFREGIKKCTASDNTFKVVFEAENGKELISSFEKVMPDVIIMDLKMPIMDGIEATQIIRKKFPEVKILVVTMYGEEKFITHLMEIGANGYLLKNSEPEEIRRSIYAVYETGYYFNDIMSKTLLKNLSIINNITPSFNQGIELSEIELKILKLICNEKNEEEIAKEINSEVNTVTQIQKQLIKKIGVRNIGGLVMYAIKNGIIN